MACMLCSVCQESLIDVSKRVYFCVECSPDIANGNVTYWCNNCKKSTEHEHIRKKMKGQIGNPFANFGKSDKDAMSDE